MKMPDAIPVTLIAPCGMNCAVCYVYLRKKKPCLGCRGHDEAKPDHCRQCKIKDCAQSRGADFCFNCPTFPCAVIKRLDKSYRQRYQVSLIENTLRLETIGARQFMIEEREKWTCMACGGAISLHDRVCSECGRRA
jgi:hypothetical protein